jgi:hypothetical protein
MAGAVAVGLRNPTAVIIDGGAGARDGLTLTVLTVSVVWKR